MDNLARSTVVSSESEDLILVDENDHPVGVASKGACHDGDGILHRAFSLFIFDRRGRLLLQQRSGQKRLWPGYWSNSCCSHPRAHETMEDAVHRRLEQELGIRSELEYLYKFQYQAHYGDLGSEHELCHVYAGRSDDPVQANVNEIADWRFVAPAELDREMQRHPHRFTPWFKLEWEHIKAEYPQVVDEATS